MDMNISAGISRIDIAGLDGNSIRTERHYVWPVYNAGRVARIRGVTRRTDSNAVYSKPNSEDIGKLSKLLNDMHCGEYTRSGRLGRSGLRVHAGTFFDAIV